MTLKTGILAAAAALALTVPAAAFAQPAYAPHYGYREGYREDFRRPDFRRDYDFRRAEEWRRIQRQREHAYRYSFGNPYYR
jgi:hypothetical protein